MEFDLYELSDRKLKELHNYVERCHQQNREAKQKQEQEKMIGDQMKVMMEEKQQTDNNLLDQQLQYQ